MAYKFSSEWKLANFYVFHVQTFREAEVQSVAPCRFPASFYPFYPIIELWRIKLYIIPIGITMIWKENREEVGLKTDFLRSIIRFSPFILNISLKILCIRSFIIIDLYFDANRMLRWIELLILFVNCDHVDTMIRQFLFEIKIFANKFQKSYFKWFIYQVFDYCLIIEIK